MAIDERTDAAIQRYQQRLRRPRIIYAAVVVGVIAVLVSLFVVAWEHGEITHVSMTTASVAPPSVPLQSTPATLSTRWSTSDASALGTPYYQGTVVTSDQHTVRGRNALTGKQTWAYTRTDRVVCSAVQINGVTIAIYALDGNCDELTALNTDTGARLWTRTLDENGAIFDGSASVSVAPDGIVLLASRTSVYTISPSGADDPNGGLDYWTFYHPGCTIHGAVLGTAGALIAQTCHGENCSGLKFCRNGSQLLLRQETTGRDDSSTKNPDKIVWLRPSPAGVAPVSAGDVISALRVPANGSSAGQLEILTADGGRVTAALPLPDGAGRSTTLVPVSGGAVVWLRDVMLGYRDGTTRFAWQQQSYGPPSAVTGSNGGTQLTAAVRDGAVSLDPATGKVLHHYSIPRPPLSSSVPTQVTPFGTGLLITGGATGFDA